MDDVYEEVAEAREKDHIDAHEPHYAQSQVDEDMLIPTIELIHVVLPVVALPKVFKLITSVVAISLSLST